MKKTTPCQQRLLDFIREREASGASAPSYQEIADHFGYRSLDTVRGHVQALVRKGAVVAEPGRARSLRAASPFRSLRRPVVDIPVFGSIPAGLAEDRHQEAEGCLSIDVETLGIHPTPRTFALEVRGDSMVGRHIIEGDIVILEHGRTPRPGDVVAALIDNESTLKTFWLDGRQRPYLRAENPKYPDLIPAAELVIQGVMIAMVRKAQPR